MGIECFKIPLDRMKTMILGKGDYTVVGGGILSGYGACQIIDLHLVLLNIKYLIFDNDVCNIASKQKIS